MRKTTSLMRQNFLLYFFSFLTLMACSTTTEQGAVGVDRRQLLLVSSDQIEKESADEYSQVKKEAQSKGQLDQKPDLVRRVQTVVKRLIPQTGAFRKDAPGWAWEVHVISSDELNAYCMPGGKIMFYSNLIEKLQLTDAEIAAVMGHEISHALREHGRERYSQAMLEQLALQGAVASGKVSANIAQLAGAGMNLLVLMPFGRNQETEADEMGVELMARAGYNPDEALSLWKKMASMGGPKPPEILSTHPADQKRLNQIQALLPKVRPLYEQAKK